MKKLFALLLIVIASFTVVSCDFLNSTTVANTTAENTTRAEMTGMTTTEIITTSNVTTSQVTTIQTTTNGTTTNQTTTLEPVTTQTTDNPLDLFKPTGYSLLQDELDVVGIPSIGSPKVLVFAVDFSDYTSDDFGIPISDIETVFNGSKGDMEFESLNSFYLESSYGKLDLTADVFGYYTASQPASYYETEFTKLWAVNPITGDYLYDDDEVTYPESSLIYEILNYYNDDANGIDIDYSDYDYNNDGFIDGIYIVYTHPVSYKFGSDLWWAYQDYYAYEGDLFDGVEPLYFCWSGTDFMTEDDPLNARTIIHESGHMMGLDDYYDYDKSDNYNEGGLAGADMMDSAYGDHGAFSKLLLGWITPIVVEGTITIDILPFVNNGDVILVIDEWNNTIFDEYFLITFYTPTGLYEEDAFVYFTIPGILIYHVSAEIGDGFINDSAYWTIFNNNNTDTQDKVVKYLEADNDHSVEDTDYTENSDLFQEGDIFGDSVFSNYQWYDGLDVTFDIEIDLVSLTTAEITITFE